MAVHHFVSLFRIIFSKGLFIILFVPFLQLPITDRVYISPSGPVTPCTTPTPLKALKAENTCTSARCWWGTPHWEVRAWKYCRSEMEKSDLTLLQIEYYVRTCTSSSATPRPTQSTWSPFSGSLCQTSSDLIEWDNVAIFHTPKLHRPRARLKYMSCLSVIIVNTKLSLSKLRGRERWDTIKKWIWLSLSNGISQVDIITPVHYLQFHQ